MLIHKGVECAVKSPLLVVLLSFVLIEVDDDIVHGLLELEVPVVADDIFPLG